MNMNSAFEIEKLENISSDYSFCKLLRGASTYINMEMTCSTKRKKRRTRRYLDEIRNRLRRGCGDSFEHSIQNTTTSSLAKPTKRKDRLVTMDRLTLKAMFPNAIRSETITRPVLEEIKQKQHENYTELLKDCTVKKVYSLDQDLSCKDKNTSANFRNKTFSAHSTENNHIKRDEAISSSSPILFSPATSVNKAVTQNRLVNEEDVSSTSSQASQDCINHRYENLINEIPSYIRHMASSVNKEDTIKDTINNLQQLYMESQRKEYKETIMKSNCGHTKIKNKIFGSENQLIVENPLDYIRLKHERQKNEGSPPGSLLNSPSYGPSGGSIATPQGGSLGELLPCRDSPDSPWSTYSAKPRSARSGGVHLYDTPDYAYYPHPLK